MYEENPEYISHFGVPGMKWGVRRQRAIAEYEAHINKLQSQGKTKAAARKSEKLKIYKKRLPSELEVAKIGQQVRDGTNVVQKILNIDKTRMIKELTKDNLTRGERLTMTLVNDSIYFPFGLKYTMWNEIAGKTKYSN